MYGRLIAAIGDPTGFRLAEEEGRIHPAALESETHLSEIAGLFLDQEQALATAAVDDIVVYSSSTAEIPERGGELGLATIRIEPGSVGGEFFMTHGHVHQRFEGEAYVTMAGRGGLLLRNGPNIAWVEMRSGVVGHIPAGWAHRTVNVGEEPFTFLAVYPRLAIHDFAPVGSDGMGARVLRGNATYRVVRDDGVTIAGDPRT